MEAWGGWRVWCMKPLFWILMRSVCLRSGTNYYDPYSDSVSDLSSPRRHLSWLPSSWSCQFLIPKWSCCSTSCWQATTWNEILNYRNSLLERESTVAACQHSLDGAFEDNVNMYTHIVSRSLSLLLIHRASVSGATAFQSASSCCLKVQEVTSRCLKASSGCWSQDRCPLRSRWVR